SDSFDDHCHPLRADSRVPSPHEAGPPADVRDPGDRVAFRSAFDDGAGYGGGSGRAGGGISRVGWQRSLDTAGAADLAALVARRIAADPTVAPDVEAARSEEHTSELQSREN